MSIIILEILKFVKDFHEILGKYHELIWKSPCDCFIISYRPRVRFSSAYAIQCKVPKRLKVPHAKKRMKKNLNYFLSILQAPCKSTTANCRCEMAQSNLFADFFPHYHHYTKTPLFRLNFTIFLKNTASYIVAQHPSLSTSNWNLLAYPGSVTHQPGNQSPAGEIYQISYAWLTFLFMTLGIRSTSQTPSVVMLKLSNIISIIILLNVK